MLLDEIIFEEMLFFLKRPLFFEEEPSISCVCGFIFELRPTLRFFKIDAVLPFEVDVSRFGTIFNALTFLILELLPFDTFELLTERFPSHSDRRLMPLCESD